MFNLFKKKKEPVYSIEFIPGEEDVDVFSIHETKCFKDGEYTHSVKVLCFPASIIERLEKIKKASG